MEFKFYIDNCGGQIRCGDNDDFSLKISEMRKPSEEDEASDQFSEQPTGVVYSEESLQSWRPC